jgi:hypothetical protein
MWISQEIKKMRASAQGRAGSLRRCPRHLPGIKFRKHKISSGSRQTVNFGDRYAVNGVMIERYSYPTGHHAFSDFANNAGFPPNAGPKHRKIDQPGQKQAS